ncbi:MAG: cysteine desulfurase DndA [Verrucomicrobiales bacterium]|nr:cysteine desulfurase DndA [Verrucomicrobiales bacterium]
MPVYLDCNATTPIEPEVAEVVEFYLREEFGNSGSRTHEYGNTAKRAVQVARSEVAALVNCNSEEVIFSSGATESNNMAILGLAAYGEQEGRRHLITSSIEHKAVLEPFEELERRGFEVSYLKAEPSGQVAPGTLNDALRVDTLLVSLMQVNNETGIRQPIEEYCDVLADHPAFFHVDAAQGFGKIVEPLQNQRIDLISASAHKIYGPKGVGSLVARRRGYDRLPLAPLMVGGGQERGLRPGTLPVPLIAGFGKAVELARSRHVERRRVCSAIKTKALEALNSLNPSFTGNQDFVSEHVLHVSFAGLNSEAAIVSLKDLIAISNGSACTSSSYTPSHVLLSQGMTEEEANQCLRISWCHLTEEVDWEEVAARIQAML